MSRKIRRRLKRAWRRNDTPNAKESGLQLENLERRVLLDVAGFWDEMGWRSASGGGVTWDEVSRPGEAQLVLSNDGDPAILWTEGEFVEYVEDPVPFHWEVRGDIYARQYADALGWWDLSPGSGDDRQFGAIDTTEITDPLEAEIILSVINSHVNEPLIQVWEGDTLRVNSESRQIAAAGGPNGRIAVVWVATAIPDWNDNGEDDEIYGKIWDGTNWIELGNSALGGGISNDDVVNEKPDVVINELGEVFVSYTAIHPFTGQREIVVKKFGYDYDNLDGPPTSEDLVWIELVNAEVDLFGINDTSSVSNDLANSFDSSIAVDAEGRPVVVWTSDNFEGNMEIYLKRWDGDSWEEIGQGSASESDTDGLSGISNDPSISIQPDIAIAPNDDIIVTWVNWSDWQNYDNPDTGGGQAGIYVMRSIDGAGTWTAYDTGSTTGFGIAPSLGWYYKPQIDVTSNSEPLITWQGWGADERYALDRDLTAGNPASGKHTPGLPGNPDNESPIMGVYAGFYRNTDGNFSLLDNPNDPNDQRANPTAIIDGDFEEYHCWMPTVIVAPNDPSDPNDDEIIMGYTWRDNLYDAYHHDSEIFVQAWAPDPADPTDGEWQIYGRGSNFCGNDVFGGPENSAGWHSESHVITTEGEIQLGLVDFDEDPETEMDVLLANGEHVYLYNRQTDAWSLLDPPDGYGLVFDLRGEPEVEHNVNGSPLLAYLDDTTGLPYVLQWSGGAWNMVGGGPAFSQPGIMPSDPYSTGITVQAGPNGSIFLGYLIPDGVSSDLYTLLWDGDSWKQIGTVSESSMMQPLFYANFDGYNFDDIDITETSVDNRGRISPNFSQREFEQWYLDVYEQWTSVSDFFSNDRGYFDGDSEDRDIAGEATVEAEGDGAAGPLYVPGNNGRDDEALVLKLTIEESDYLGYQQDAWFQGSLINHFRLIEEDYVVIEMMYAIDTFNMDANLFLALDGEVVDVNPNDTIPLSPINSIIAGSSATWEQGDDSIPSTVANMYANSIQDRYTTLSLDTKQMQDAYGFSLAPLAAGAHEVVLLAVSQVTCPDLGPDIVEQDNNGFPTDTRFAFSGDASAAGYYDGWTFPESDNTSYTWSSTAGSGADGGLTLTINDNTSTDWPTTHTGWIERPLTLFGGGFVETELEFALTDVSLAGTDTLDLLIFMVDTNEDIVLSSTLGSQQIEAGENIAYTSVSLTHEPTAMLPGDYTLRIAAVLTDTDGVTGSKATLSLDDIVITTTDGTYTSDFDTDPLMQGWEYADIAGDANVDGSQGDSLDGGEAEPDGALVMTFDDAAAEVVHGGFSYGFSYGGPVTIEFDYKLTASADLPADEILALLVSIDGNYLTFPYDAEGNFNTNYEYSVTADGTEEQPEEDTFEITLEGLDSVLASGDHVIRIEGLLYDPASVDGGDGTATLAIDNFRLYGIEASDNDTEGELPDWLEPAPHRVHVRVDNFAVYQRVVSGKTLDDTENLLNTEGPFDFDDLGALPASLWSYVDIEDPDNEVTGDWTNDAGVGGTGSGDDALVMTLGDNADVVSDLAGRFVYSFTLADDAFMDVELDYYLETDLNIDAGETLGMTISIDGDDLSAPITIYTDQIIASGGGTRASGWKTLSLVDLGQLNTALGAEFITFSAGDYELVIDAVLSRSGRDRTGTDGVVTEDDTAGQAFVKIDNVTIKEYSGIGDWEYEDAGGDTGWDSPDPLDPTADDLWGSNDFVGPDSNRDNGERQGQFDFGACLHSSLGAAGTQRYVIEDVTQWEGGDMVIGFRYRLDSDDPLSLSVLIDGVEYNDMGENAPISTPDSDYTGDMIDWWNYDNDNTDLNDPIYSYVIVTAENIDAGEHDISIELNNTSFTSQTELYIDNLFILSTRATNSIMPQATLLPTGSDGQRHFAVALTSQSPNLWVYEDDTDIYPDGPIVSYAIDYDVMGGYHTAAVFELMSDTNTWQLYGDIIAATLGVDYFPDTNDQALPETLFEVPAAEVYLLEDLTVGPDAMLWVALQHAEAEWVDTDRTPDGINDRADIHPWLPREETYHGSPTTLDLAVLRWDPFNDPLDDIQGESQRWQDTGFVPLASATAYTDVELISSGGQLPSVAYTARGSNSGIGNSYVQRYEPTDVWGVLGTENVENTQSWSANWLRDMIAREDGFPIVSYYLTHLDTDGVREFRREETLPDMEISEFSGTPNDNILDFGTITNIVETDGFTLFNNGPGDLIVYDVQIAGIGSLASLPANPFTFFDLPQFPLTLETGEQEAINIRFDPANVPAGQYTAVLLVHSNNGSQPSHPFTHFQEILLNVEVSNGAEVALNTSFLTFENTIVDETSTAQNVIISNQGVGPLTIHQWLFDGNNFEIVQAWITNSNQVVTPTSIANDKGADDDVEIPADGFLTLQITFHPDDIALFSETFYIQTSDDDEPFVVVALAGQGVSNAQIVVEENSGTQNDDIIDFGNVVMGTTSDPIPITIRNDGTTDLEISDITIGTNAATVMYFTFADPALSVPFTLDKNGGSTVINVYYAPTVPELTGQLVPVDLETTITIFSDDRVTPSYDIAVQATAIPLLPILVVTDESGVEMSVPRRLNFGTLNIGQQLQQTFLVKNEGGADLTLERFVINASNSPFTIEPINTAASDDDISLATNQTQLVTVTYTPTAVGVIQNTLEIISDDQDIPNANTRIILQAEAVNPVLEVTDSYADPGDFFIDFGVIAQNQSGWASIIMENQGDSGDIVISNWSLSDPAFSIDPVFTSQISISPGQQQVLEVTFTPATLGQFTDSITISYINPLDSGDEIDWPPITITGQAVTPGQAAITDSELTSPDGVINFTTEFCSPLIVGLDSSQQTCTLTNNGASPLLVKGILVTSVYGMEPPDSWSQVEFTSSPFHLSIPNRGTRMDPDNPDDDLLLDPGQSVQVAVAFTPTNRFDGQAWITFVTNDPSQSDPDTTHHVIVSGQSIFARQVGEMAGFTQSKFVFYDEDNDKVKVKVTGGGYAVVVLENGAGNSSDIESIELFNTTRNTTLTVISQGETHIGQILGDTVKNITLKNMVLDGDGVTGYAIDMDSLTGTLTTGTIINGADICIGGTGENQKGAKIKLQSVGDDSDLIVNAPIATLSMSSYGNGTIQATSIKNLKVRQEHFGANMVLDAGLDTLTARKSTFTGSLNADSANKLAFDRLLGADIGIRGYLKKLTVNTDMLDSRVLAGYNLNTNQLFRNAEIGSVNVKGRFDNSNIAAGIAPYSDTQFFEPAFQNDSLNGSIGNVHLGDAIWDNSGILFGVSAAGSIDTVRVNNITFPPGAEQVDFRVLLL